MAKANNSPAIYYFSATGNSLAVARELGQKFPQSKLIGLANALKTNRLKVDTPLVGLVFPVYSFGLPKIIIEFIQKAKFLPGSYLFAVATNGGLCGATLLQLNKLLKAKNQELALGFQIQLPSNYTPLWNPPTMQRQQKSFKRMKEKIKIIAELVRKRSVGRVEHNSWVTNGLIWLTRIYPGFIHFVAKSDNRFLVQDSCNGCGLCAKVCPVDNIRLVKRRPRWLHRCQHCLACLHWCPVEAIQFTRITIGRARYHYPGIRAMEIAAQKQSR